ncbi:hypothetical protein ACXR3Q_28360, partial [Klebsiella pneumoniae]
AEQEGQQTETEATGAPQKHHYTLNQQVGSITRVEMGIKGRKRIQDKFSSGMIISKTLKTYHDVVEG